MCGRAHTHVLLNFKDRKTRKHVGEGGDQHVSDLDCYCSDVRCSGIWECVCVSVTQPTQDN